MSYAAPDEIQRTLNSYVSQAPGVVVIVGVIEDGKASIYTAGTPPHGAPALNQDTLFQIGSISKTFTATLLAEMVERGEIRLDDPLTQYFPSSVRVPSYHGEAITLLSLAEQNSGLPRLPTNLNPPDPGDPYAAYTTDDLYQFLSGYTLTRAPGATYEYSNLGGSVLGLALADSVHESFTSLIQSRIFEPLGMSESTFTPERVFPGFSAKLTSAKPWTGAFLAPAGGINSSMRDMLKYLRANLDAPAGPLGKAMAFAQEPRAAVDGMPSYVKIGLMWLQNVDNSNVFFEGETGGYHSTILFNVAQHRGIVLLTNVADMNAGAVALHILAPGQIPAPAPVTPKPD
jgi:serine-type D-Ala-D-Ala carboxypeptidase/endopeptidase